MADGTPVPGATGGDTIWTEDVGDSRGKIQRFKLVQGALDTDGGDTGSANPLNVQFPTLFGAANPGSVAPQTGYAEVTAAGIVSGSTTLMASVDALAYKSISIHVIANSSTDTVTWQTSNDETNWVGFCLAKSTDTSAALVTTAAATTGIWSGPLPGRYFRLIRNATLSTISAVAELRQ